MKKVFAVLTCLALFLLPKAATAEEFLLFSGLTTSGSFGCNPPEKPFAACQMNGWNKASFQVTSAAGSVATVELKQRNTSADPWVTIVTVTNPGAAELGYTGIAVGELECVVTYVSGTLRATLVRSQ